MQEIKTAFRKESDFEDFDPIITNSKKNKCKKIEETFALSKEDKASVLFEFKSNPEYIRVGDHVIINEACFKAFGYVSKIFKN